MMYLKISNYFFHSDVLNLFLEPMASVGRLSCFCILFLHLECE